MGQNSLRFVQVSDLHFGQESIGDKLPYDDIRKQIIRDAATFKSDYGACNGILVAGDIAFKADKAEYTQASLWLDQLAESIGCEKTKVCVVPGNHDVDRSSIKTVASAFIEKIRSNPLDAHNILAALAKEEPHNHPLFSPLANYQVFAEQYNCPFESPSKPSWSKSFKFPSGHTLEIVGMTSVIVSDKNDAPEKVVLGSEQFILEDADTKEYFVMFHHPICWLMDSDEASDYLFSRARTILTGHKHRQRIHVHKRMSGEEVLMLDSGATTPPRNESIFGFVYNWLEFDLDVTSADPSLEIKIFPRCWNRANTRFAPDSSQCGGQVYSRFQIICPRFRPQKCVVSTTDRANSDDLMNAREVDMTTSNLEDLEEVRLRFWRLDDKPRLKILLDLDLLPAVLNNNAISLWQERAAFQKAVRENKIGILKKEIEKLDKKPLQE